MWSKWPYFYSAHPTGWAEFISGNGVGVCVYVHHHFKDYEYLCSQASQTPITIHILKAYDESHSKIIRGHKYKDKDNDKDMTKTKTQTKYLKNPTYAIFSKSWWLTHSKYDDRYLTLVILLTLVTLVLQGRLHHRFRIFFSHILLLWFGAISLSGDLLRD